jgi:peptidoglycan-N-acetylglucosamine deacetylase
MLVLAAALGCVDEDGLETRSPPKGGDDPGTHPGSPTDPPTGDTTDPWTTPTGGSTTTTTPWSDLRRWDCSGMDPADPAPLGGNVILTFDDGPDPVDTPVILDILRGHGIPATFFVLGENLADPAAWSIAEDIVADPLFDLANHSWDHLDLADADTATVEAEIDDTTDLIETFGVTPTFFRFPYGDSTCGTHDLVTDRGLLVTGWHIDTADWCYAAGGGICTNADYWRVPEEYEADMLGLSLEQIHRFDGGVVLFHDIHQFTANALEEFVTTLLDEGYRFTALTDTSVLPNLNAGTPADLPYLGEHCVLSDDDCWQVEHDAWCEPVDPSDPSNDHGICTLPCEGYCYDRDGAATTFCADVGGAGQCVAWSDPINGFCSTLPGTVEADLDRFVGSSGAGDAVGTVCAPTHW